MFNKFFGSSKELNFFTVLTFIAGLEATGAWPIITKVINFFPDSTAGMITAVLIGIIGVAAWILRTFYTDGKIEFFKKNVTTDEQNAAITEVSELIKANPDDVIEFKKAAEQLKEKRELEALQAQMARLKELEAKQQPAA